MSISRLIIRGCMRNRALFHRHPFYLTSCMYYPSSSSSSLTFQLLNTSTPSLIPCSTLCTLQDDKKKEEEKINKKWTVPHLSMDEETRKKKEDKIEEQTQEEKPKSLWAKLKYYFKRYWYIAVPVHMVCSFLWFGALYAAVYSGMDVISILETLHLPNGLIEKIKNVPPSAGMLVIAVILYKMATPARYATTLAGIQLTFWTLRRMGRLRTVTEVEYGMRNAYTRRRFKTNGGVRSVRKKSSNG